MNIYKKIIQEKSESFPYVQNTGHSKYYNVK